MHTGPAPQQVVNPEDTRAINHPDYRAMMRKRKITNRKKAKASRGARRANR